MMTPTSNHGLWIELPPSPLGRGVDLALDALRAQARRHGLAVEIASADQSPPLFTPLHLTLDPEAAAALNVQREGFALWHTLEHNDGITHWRLTAADEAGLTYGLRDLAEQVQQHGQLDALEPRTVNPRFELRALKFNLPWSSYRPGEVMTQHQDTCRDERFWLRLLDMLATHRFNALTLWSIHPFPWMLRPTGYEEACEFDDDELSRWQTLWRTIFREARARCIDTYIVTWNIFVSPSFARKHGITFPGNEYLWGDGDTSDLVKAYNRQCITQLIDEYEDLTGLGVTLGERMQNMEPAQRQQWVEQVVFPAVRDASRPIKFIHRAPFTADPMIMRQSLSRANLPGPVYVEYKFNWSHAHSTPTLAMTHDVGPKVQGQTQPVDDRYWNPPPDNYRMAWMARNEDFFILRWGEPDFIRAHIAANGHSHAAGYFVGSEGYIPAKDYSHIRPHDHLTWDYAFEKQWLFYMMWGRLLYDPATPDSVFESAFDDRFGRDVGRDLLRAYTLASRVPLRIASFHAGTWDYTLYSEGFLAPFPSFGRGGKQPFISIDDFMKPPTLDPTLMSIAEYAQLHREGRESLPGRITPIELARQCEVEAVEIFQRIAAVRLHIVTPSGTLASELADLEAWAALGRYLACKLCGGVALALYRDTGDPVQQREALRQLQRGLDHWDALIANTRDRYQQVPYIERFDYVLRFHWQDFRDAVADDIRIAREARPRATPAIR